MVPTPPIPQPILAGTPGSFARAVFHERHPKLIARVLDALPYTPVQRAALEALLAESIGGEMRPLSENTADRGRWLDWGAEHYGKPWGEAPFLWAESFFYRRLLEATGYHRPGPWRGIDPFAPFKTAELHGTTVTGQLDALDRLDTLDPRTQLLPACLWGNRADLGFQLTATASESSEALLIDDSAQLWSTLEGAAAPRLDLIADNAAGELLPDLILIDHLLTTGIAAEVRLWVKPAPYFVSDATTADVLATLALLRTSPSRTADNLAARLADHIGTARLIIDTHEFFCAPLPFADMPDDLARQLAGAQVTVLKGDLNYRRLVGDRHWPATTPFAETTGAFPAAVVALRTLKSDVVVGLTAEQEHTLDTDDPGWRTSGTHALISAAPGARE
ncbi:damage-control phosphatase ARMT1 family protein [Nocardia sp. NPDC057227]|uniref:damage-control phosphatase ARMT1 family protein n=1 Tax=Nocardia sp. NPDC057227 TaxID=3346056 RepID=UPI003633F9DC